MNKRRARHILYALVALAIAFIWGNSLLSQSDSGALSSTVESFLLRLLNMSELPFDIRKLAHFCEYALLGALSCALLVLAEKPGLSLAANHVSAGLFAAVIDESIQLFTGRGPQIMDVLIDFGGYMTGFVFVSVLYLVIFHRPKRTQ